MGDVRLAVDIAIGIFLLVFCILGIWVFFAALGTIIGAKPPKADGMIDYSPATSIVTGLLIIGMMLFAVVSLIVQA